MLDYKKLIRLSELRHEYEVEELDLVKKYDLFTTEYTRWLENKIINYRDKEDNQ